MFKKFWRKLVEKNNRLVAEVIRMQLEMDQQGVLKPPRPLFPKRPYKTSTVILFSVFGFFVLMAAWAVFKNLIVPLF